MSVSDSLDAKVLEHTLKSGHSLSMEAHSSNVPHTVHPQSRMLAKMRSIPKIPVDTSYEAVQESINRSVMHKMVYDNNPQVFRRGGASDSNFSRFNATKHDVRNLLPDMHPVSDPKDICPPKFGYNFSKLKREEPELRTSIEDFLQPKSQTRERKTGYNSGHIRTVLELDTFGPKHSDSVSEARMIGSLPMSPNLDRNRASDTKSRGTLSRASSGLWEDSTVGSNTVGSNGVRTKGLFGGTWNQDALKQADDDRSQPLIRPSTSGYQQDTRQQNWNYSKQRTAMLKDQEEGKRQLEKQKKDLLRQEKESKEYQNYVNEFEVHLKSIKYY